MNSFFVLLAKIHKISGFTKFFERNVSLLPHILTPISFALSLIHSVLQSSAKGSSPSSGYVIL